MFTSWLLIEHGLADGHDARRRARWALSWLFYTCSPARRLAFLRKSCTSTSRRRNNRRFRKQSKEEHDDDGLLEEILALQVVLAEVRWRRHRGGDVEEKFLVHAERKALDVAPPRRNVDLVDDCLTTPPSRARKPVELLTEMAVGRRVVPRTPSASAAGSVDDHFDGALVSLVHVPVGHARMQRRRGRPRSS